MSAETRRRKKKAVKDAQKAVRRQVDTGELIEVFAQLDCGCCSSGPMVFKDVHSAQRAFNATGLTNFGKVTDDAGTVHTGIDTFYGYTVGRLNTRGLPYLAGYPDEEDEENL